MAEGRDLLHWRLGADGGSCYANGRGGFLRHEFRDDSSNYDTRAARAPASNHRGGDSIDGRAAKIMESPWNAKGMRGTSSLSVSVPET